LPTRTDTKVRVDNDEREIMQARQVEPALRVWVAGCGVEDMAAKTPGWRSGSSPEAAKRCGTSRRALRATTVPVKMNADGEIRIGLFSGQDSAIDFVADGAENAGHRFALSVEPATVRI
jgi:hypothetical protein